MTVALVHRAAEEGRPGLGHVAERGDGKHGGGMTWQPVTYDPELNLIYVTTGNPQPVIAHKNRAGDNLYTGSIVALDADTGKMAWHFQASPHDTHDWDATQTPVLIDGDGQRSAAQAARAGRAQRPLLPARSHQRQAIVSTEFVKTNWSTGLRRAGQPMPNPAKMPQIAGALVSPNQGGATNWQSPSFNPQTGLFYVTPPRVQRVLHLRSRATTRWVGAAPIAAASRSRCSRRSTTRPARSAGRHTWEDSRLAGHRQHRRQRALHRRLGRFVALNATTGDALWHSRIGTDHQRPITYELDGEQHVVVASGNNVFDFVLNKRLWRPAA